MLRIMTTFVAFIACASALTLTPQLSASAASARTVRAAALRMDDIPMKKDDRGVQPKNRPPFACSFEIPKKGISEYGMCNMKFKPLLTDSEVPALSLCRAVKGTPMQLTTFCLVLGSS